MKPTVPACSFCGKTHLDGVKKFIAGPACYICDECVYLASTITDDQNKAVAYVAKGFIEDVATMEREYDAGFAGGQRGTSSMPFGNVSPSTRGTLRHWAKRFEAALEDKP